MSFTSDVKQELSLKTYDPQEERAVLSALIQMTSSISVSSKGTAISLVTENASVSRAAYRMNQEGQSGAKTLFDVPPAYLSHQSREELLAHML